MIPYLKRLRFNDAAGRQDRSSPQDASHGPAHDGAADRTAHLAPERFSDVCRDLACHTVGDRTGDFASDDLAGGQALSARPTGTENAAQHVAEPTQHGAESLAPGSPG